MTREVDAIAEAEAALSESVRRQAAAFVPDAIESLGTFARGGAVNGIDPSASVVAKTARDIIEFAGGRPETRDPNTTDPSQQVHIYIQDFGTKEYRELNASIDREDQSSKLLEAEEMVANDVSDVFEVEYAETDPGEAT